MARSRSLASPLKPSEAPETVSRVRALLSPRLTSATPFSLKGRVRDLFEFVTRFAFRRSGGFFFRSKAYHVAHCRRNRVDFPHDARLESIDESGTRAGEMTERATALAIVEYSGLTCRGEFRLEGTL